MAWSWMMIHFDFYLTSGGLKMLKLLAFLNFTIKFQSSFRNFILNLHIFGKTLLPTAAVPFPTW